MIVADDHTLGATLTRIYTFIFNFNYDTTPLWYLYMLVGLYLIMPVIGAWLQQASRRDIRLVLYVWGVTLLLPYIKWSLRRWGIPAITAIWGFSVFATGTVTELSITCPGSSVT